MVTNKIGLIGDLHGNERWAVSVLDALAEQGIKKVIQVGDFGIWPGESGKWYLHWVMQALETNGQTMWVVPGNHEDYSQIDDPEDPNGGVQRQVWGFGPNWELAILPRGFVWDESYDDPENPGDWTRSFVALGGAPSIDYQHRTPGKSWWPEEMIRESDLERLKNWAVGSDVMITHDAPLTGNTSAVQSIIDTPWDRSGWSEAGLIYARKGQEIMQRAIDIVQPRVFCHGHFHARGILGSDERTMISLSMDGTAGNFGVLDLCTLKFEFNG